MNMKAFGRMIDANLTGYLVVAQEALRRMRAARKGGSLINVSSIGAVQPLKGLGPYCVTKAAVNTLTAVLATEVGAEGIRVNAVAPGLIRTSFTEALWSNESIESKLRESTPLGRLGEPEDVASVVAFLASDAARYVTGETIVIDGGMLQDGLGEAVARKPRRARS
jgi:NAD(P)-dependent dehydrogenase (short-subunit alcohol dehydrogenase family)